MINQTGPSSNAATPTTFPQTRNILLSLEVEFPDQEHLQYMLDDAGNLQLGFIADLFDLLNFESELGVVKINGVTPAEATKPFQKLVP